MSDDPALFYPSLTFTLQVLVLGDHAVCASQDFGTTCAENRHFVDYEYLKSIMGKEELKNNLVATSTSLLTGTRIEPGERVLGMLPSLKVYIHIGEGTDNIWSVHTLSNVMVVDSLPVPLHISLKTIKVYPKNQIGGLKASHFPPQYQTHPYWVEELSDDSDKPAIFYPALSCKVQVQVMGADTVCASHDMGTACAENRHFVDYEYLKSTMGEEELKNNLVATTTSLLTGTRKAPGERVLGMLPSLKVYIHIGEGTDNIWSVHTLSNVMVVDSLPVPLHISLKTIKVSPKNQNIELEATSFPPQYQTHPYWDEELRETIHYIGLGF